MMVLKKILAYLGALLMVVLLTVVTQVGGLVFIVSGLLARVFWRQPTRLKKWGLFTGLYLLTALVVLPLVAPIFGRKPLPASAAADFPARPASWFYVLANRHYVKPELWVLTQKTSRAFQQQYPDAVVVYLDANFPFFEGFPLLPHLSHDDGEKLDFAFVYRHKESGRLLNDGLGGLGYGIPEGPRAGEVDQPAVCATQGYWQYDILSRFSRQSIRENYVFEPEMNRALLRLLLREPACGKVFIEPHLKTRLQLQGEAKIRFQGCHSVRHDDHIHIQL